MSSASRRAIGAPSTPFPGVAAVLRERLAFVLGDELAAEALLADALRESGRGALPHDTEACVTFARAHLLRPLLERRGPRLVAAFLDDLETLEASQVRPTSRPIASPARRLIALIDRDRFRRALIAQALLRSELDVVAGETPAEVARESADLIVWIAPDAREIEECELSGIAVTPRETPASARWRIVRSSPTPAAVLAAVRAQLNPDRDR